MDHVSSNNTVFHHLNFITETRNTPKALQVRKNVEEFLFMMTSNNRQFWDYILIIWTSVITPHSVHNGSYISDICLCQNETHSMCLIYMK